MFADHKALRAATDTIVCEAIKAGTPGAHLDAAKQLDGALILVRALGLGRLAEREIEESAKIARANADYEAR